MRRSGLVGYEYHANARAPVRALFCADENTMIGGTRAPTYGVHKGCLIKSDILAAYIVFIDRALRVGSRDVTALSTRGMRLLVACGRPWARRAMCHDGVH